MTEAPAGSVREMVPPWWASVTALEVNASADLVSGLLDPASTTTAGDENALARAVALQQLFAHETLLDDLLRNATQRTRTFLRAEGDEGLDAAGRWLQHCKLLARVLCGADDLLNAGKSGRRRSGLDAFAEEVKSLGGHLVRLAAARGLAAPIPPMPPITFRKRRPD